MAAKKARKRAYIPPAHEVINRREATETTRTVRASAPRPQRGSARGEYVYPVPSWKRTLKRLPIYFVLIFALQFYLLGTGDKAVAGNDRLTFAILQAGVVTICFAPFMHMMDRFAYNRYLKRSGGAAATKSKR
ncbi:MAG: hypothetical protein ABI200_04745 [Gaiellales bacterium]